MSNLYQKPDCQAKRPYMHLRYLMWSLPLAFFTYQFILRLWPSLMMQQIMQQFTIDATSFGLLASAYYYGYAGMQIPVAIMLEKYGPRLVLFGCALMCGLATFLFTTTDNWTMAILSRFMIGAGSAAGFLTTSKVISQWFPQENYGRMVGFSFSVGLMGAIYGGKPIGLLVADWGGQPVAMTLCAISVLIGILAYVFLRSPVTVETPSTPQNQQEASFKITDLNRLVTSPTLVLLAIANLLMVGALEGFADVWGVSYLMTAYGASKVNGAELVSFIFVGMLFGGPLLAQLSKKFGNYGVISFCGLGIALAFSYMILIHNSFDVYFLGSLFFGIGLLCCYQVLVFSAASDLVNPRMLGITVAFLNCINMLGGSFFHSLIGFFMDLYWTGESVEGLRQYSIESYTHALMLIPLCAMIGSLMVVAVGLRMRRKVCEG
jgi:predicted MFS family arabinose efflux permease